MVFPRKGFRVLADMGDQDNKCLRVDIRLYHTEKEPQVQALSHPSDSCTLEVLDAYNSIGELAPLKIIFITL